MLKICSDDMYKTLRRVIILYSMFTVVHFSSVHLYAYICVPFTLKGVFMTSFMISTPHCNALTWAIQFTKGHIVNMWILLGAFICTHIEQILHR